MPIPTARRRERSPVATFVDTVKHEPQATEVPAPVRTTAQRRVVSSDTNTPLSPARGHVHVETSPRGVCGRYPFRDGRPSLRKPTKPHHTAPRSAKQWQITHYTIVDVGVGVGVRLCRMVWWTHTRLARPRADIPTPIGKHKGRGRQRTLDSSSALASCANPSSPELDPASSPAPSPPLEPGLDPSAPVSVPVPEGSGVSKASAPLRLWLRLGARLEPGLGWARRHERLTAPRASGGRMRPRVARARAPALATEAQEHGG